MRTILTPIVTILALTSSVFASSNAETTFDNKCAMCHIKTIPTDKSSMIAPALMGVMRHVKMVYPNKQEAVDFIVDYVQNPSKDKAVCMSQKISRFGLMPSQKGNITPTELREVSEWMFDNFPSASFRSSKMQQGTASRNVTSCPGQNRSKFTQFDANADGTVTKEEFVQLRTQKQAQKKAEGMPMRNASKAPSFETIDSNSDGKITEEEFSSFWNR